MQEPSRFDAVVELGHHLQDIRIHTGVFENFGFFIEPKQLIYFPIHLPYFVKVASNAAPRISKMLIICNTSVLRFPYSRTSSSVSGSAKILGYSQLSTNQPLSEEVVYRILRGR